MTNKNLHFITGLMGAGKTKHLIDFYEDAQKQGKFVWVFAGSLHDNFFGTAKIKSRDGREVEGVPIDSDGTLVWINYIFSLMSKEDLILIDEIQFLTERQMRLIIKFAKAKKMEVYFYGLDRDFKNEQFPAVTALIKAKPEIKFIVTECQMEDCTDFAENNARIINGHVVTDGDTFLEAKSSYLSICDKCFEKMTLK